jgi:hypothetical protein
VDPRRQTGHCHQAQLDSKGSPGVSVEKVPPLYSSVADIDDPGDDKNTECRPRSRLISPTGDSRQLTLTSENWDQDGNGDLPTDPDAGRQDVQPENQRRTRDVQHRPSP